MAKNPDFRRIIAKAAKQQEMSLYELGGKSTLHRNTLYRYMRGELDLSGERIAELLALLKVRVEL